MCPIGGGLLGLLFGLLCVDARAVRIARSRVAVCRSVRATRCVSRPCTEGGMERHYSGIENRYEHSTAQHGQHSTTQHSMAQRWMNGWMDIRTGNPDIISPAESIAKGTGREYLACDFSSLASSLFSDIHSVTSRTQFLRFFCGHRRGKRRQE